MIYTFSFFSLLDSHSASLVLESDEIDVADDLFVIASKGASYSNTVPMNLLDSFFTYSSFCLNKRRGS